MGIGLDLGMPLGGEVAGGYESYPFTLAASDSFNRTNGALGNTDGAGIDGVLGGSGIAWVDKIGTWSITSNAARATAVVSNVGITVVNAGKTDGIICARPNSPVSASVGIIAHYIDADNHIRAYVTQTTLFVVQRVGGVQTTLFQPAITYVANAELVVRLDGTRLSVEYNNTYINTTAIDASLIGSTLHGMFVSGAASTWNVSEWHFINLPVYQTKQRPGIVQCLVGEYLITTPNVGEITRCSEWDIRQEKAVLSGYAFTSNVRHLFGLNLVTIATGAKVLLSNGVGWESAGQIGADADAIGDYGYFGTTHQSELLVLFSIYAHGIVTIPRWTRVYCNNIRIEQSMTTVYPKDKVTPIGTTVMHHFFNINGLTVKRSYTYSPGYKLLGWYGAMMPVSKPGVDWYKVGDNAAAAFVGDDGAKNLNTQTSFYRSWKAGGDYTVVMYLPTGGPDDNADWSRSGGYKGWLKDNAVGPKFYVNLVSGNAGEQVAAVASSHTTQYWIEFGTP